MKKKAIIRNTYGTLINLLLLYAIPLFLVVLTTSVTHAFASLVYVVNRVDGTLSVIDTSSNTVVETQSTLGLKPSGIKSSSDGKRLWVSHLDNEDLDHHSSDPEYQNPKDSSISLIDPDKTFIPIRLSGRLCCMAFPPDGEFLYVSYYDNNTVYVIHPLTGMPLNPFILFPSILIGPSIVLADVPSEITISPDGKLAYVGHAYNGTVSVIDTHSHKIVGDPITVLTEGQGSFINAIAFTPDGKFAYVTALHEICVIDTSSHTVVTRIEVGSCPFAIAVTSDGKFAYVAIAGDNSVAVIDTRSNAVVGSPIAVGATPCAITLTPDGKFAYVANRSDNTISVIDTSSNTVIAPPIPVGQYPCSIAIAEDPKK